MGFLDFLFGSGKKAKNYDNTSGKNGMTEDTVSESDAAYSITPEVQSMPERSIDEWKIYFSEILAAEFPGYTVERDVTASKLAAALGMHADFHPACTPVDFLIMKDGRPFVAMVLVRANTYRGMNVIGTKNICDVASLRYVRFFTDMPNEKEYVIGRLREILK